MNTDTVSVAPAAAESKPVLAGNFLWTLSGNVIYAACQWLILMCFAKLGSNAQMVGQYALGLAITAPVFQFCSLQLRAVQVTDARNRYRFAEFAGMRLVTTGAGILIVVCLALWGNYRGQTGWVIVFIGLSKAFESLSDLCQGQFQKNERMDLVARSLVIKGVVSLIAVSVVLRLAGGAAAAAGVLVLGGGWFGWAMT